MLTINFIFVFFIIASAVFYFYFKTRQFRTRQVFPIRKKMYASMSGASLGGLLLFFGINQLILFNGITTYIIDVMMSTENLLPIIFNFKAYKHYRSFVDEETKLNDN